MTRTIRRVLDIRYGEVLGYRPLELDLYLPSADELSPVVVYVHGGGWQRGSRRDPPPLLEADFYDQIAAQGLAVAAIDYRLSGEARFPAPLEDVRTAVDWVRDNAAAYGLELAVIVSAYAVLGEAGQLVLSLNPTAAPCWPPTGIALALL